MTDTAHLLKEKKPCQKWAEAVFQGNFCPVFEEGSCSHLGEVLISQRHGRISPGMQEKSQHWCSCKRLAPGQLTAAWLRESCKTVHPVWRLLSFLPSRQKEEKTAACGELKNGVQEMHFVSGRVPVINFIWGNKTLSIVHFLHEIGQWSKVDKHNPVQVPYPVQAPHHGKHLLNQLSVSTVYLLMPHVIAPVQW